MKPNRKFPKSTLTAIDKSKMLGIRAGTEPHRFTGIWAVVVHDRIFVRSWNDKARGWHRVFLNEARGAMQIGSREIAVRAKQIKTERLLAAIDVAYAEKYNTRSSRKWVHGLIRGSRRLTTTELLPL